MQNSIRGKYWLHLEEIHAQIPGQTHRTTIFGGTPESSPCRKYPQISHDKISGIIPEILPGGQFN